MNVIWSPAARADLEDIRDYIRADNPGRAATFINEIVEAGDAIADMPRAFPLVPRLEQRGIRRRMIGRYLIFYRIEAESVQILHVVHGARDYIQSLFP
jgi:addiction module RelE/StbE family toxin